MKKDGLMKYFRGIIKMRLTENWNRVRIRIRARVSFRIRREILL